MKKRIAILGSVLLIVIFQCTSSIALEPEEKDQSILADIQYTSVAQVEERLFFLGESLYVFDAAEHCLIKEREESIQTLCPEAKADDLLLVNGGSEVHALDTSNGCLYNLGDAQSGLSEKLENDAFSETTDRFGERRFAMPTIAQAGDREMLYLLVSNEDQPTEYDLLYFDLAGGGSGRVRTDNVILITNYKDGKMAAVIERPDLYRIIEIDIATHEVGRTLYEEAKPRYRITGMAYDQSADKLIVVTGRGLFRIADQAMIDMHAYLPEMNERVISKDFYCFVNSRLIFINESIFLMREFNDENASSSLCFANSGVSNRSIMGFIQQNPDVSVSFYPGMIWNSKEIADALLTQNSDIDIITLYAGAGLTAMRSKKYYADLSSSTMLTEDVALMYPQIRDILMDGDKLIAYPDGMSVYCWLVDARALAQMGYRTEDSTMAEWLDFVETYAKTFDADGSTYALFPQGFSKEQLVRAILMQYIVECEAVGQLDLHDAAFKGILERILKLPKSLFLKGDTEGAQIDAYDKGPSPLFVLNAALSPDEHTGFYEQYEPEYVAPPVFSTQDPSTVRGTLLVYLVNPYSQNQETAIRFIEYCARHAEPMLRFYVEQGFAQPIPNQSYIDLKEQTATEIDDLTKSMEKASPEDVAGIRAEMESKKIILKYAQKMEWLVSPTDIAAYQRMAPSITFLPFSLCFTDSSYSVSNIDLNDMVDRLMANNANVERILAEADRKYNMIRMESGETHGVP